MLHRIRYIREMVTTAIVTVWAVTAAAVVLAAVERSDGSEINYPGGKNLHFRHLLFFAFHRGQTAAEAARDICSVYGEGVLDVSTAQKWFAKFKNGDFDLEETPRSGRPSEFDEDWNSTRELAEKIDCSAMTISDHIQIIEYVHGMVSVWNPLAKRVTNATFPSSVTLRLNQERQSVELDACCGSRNFIELTADESNVLKANLYCDTFEYRPTAEPYFSQETKYTSSVQLFNDTFFVFWKNHGILGDSDLYLQDVEMGQELNITTATDGSWQLASGTLVYRRVFSDAFMNRSHFAVRTEFANVTVDRIDAPIPSFSACLSDLAPCNFLEGPPAWTIPLKNAKRTSTVSVYVDKLALLYRTRSHRNTAYDPFVIKNLSPNWIITVSPTRQTIELSDSANRITYEVDAGRVIIRRPNEADSELTSEQNNGLYLSWSDGSGSWAVANDGFVQAICYNTTGLTARSNLNEVGIDLNGNTIRFQLSETKLNANLYGLNFTININVTAELTGPDAAKFKLENTAGPIMVWLLKSENFKIELDRSKRQVRFVRNNVEELYLDGAEGSMRGYGGEVRWSTYGEMGYYTAWCGGKSLFAAAENFVAYRIDTHTAFAVSRDTVRLDFEPATLIITSDGS